MWAKFQIQIYTKQNVNPKKNIPPLFWSSKLILNALSNHFKDPSPKNSTILAINSAKSFA